MKQIFAITFAAAALAGTTLLAQEAPKAAEGSYPLTTCVVSGEPLGSMGKPFVHHQDGREVRFCCKHCLPKFNKDPQKYLKKLDAAAPAAAKS